MSARDRRLAETKFAGRESATEKAARKARERAEKDALRGERSARRHQTAPAVPPPSQDRHTPQVTAHQQSGKFDAGAWYDEHRKTPQSRKRRQNHKRSILPDAQSGGGEAFANRSAKSTTNWFTGMFR